MTITPSEIAAVSMAPLPAWFGLLNADGRATYAEMRTCATRLRITRLKDETFIPRMAREVIRMAQESSDGCVTRADITRAMTGCPAHLLEQYVDKVAAFARALAPDLARGLG